MTPRETLKWNESIPSDQPSLRRVRISLTSFSDKDALWLVLGQRPLVEAS